MRGLRRQRGVMLSIEGLAEACHEAALTDFGASSILCTCINLLPLAPFNLHAWAVAQILEMAGGSGSG